MLTYISQVTIVIFDIYNDRENCFKKNGKSDLCIPNKIKQNAQHFSIEFLLFRVHSSQQQLKAWSG